jgi:predicted nucleotidyltransferase
MMADRFIDDGVRHRIVTELDAIEREQDVRILIAVESGSRAWGFPSRDSDYDVRFVYVRKLEDYLSVTERRDVIERPIDAVLDIGGWDLRKALQLLVRSNAVLLEWLTSPVRYRDGVAVSTRLLELARTAANPSALAYHYEHQARRSFAELEGVGEAVRDKSYCYALRSALALLWLRERREAPPMDLPSLLAGLTLDEAVRESIATLVARKLSATEGDLGARLSLLDALIGGALAQPKVQRPATDRATAVAEADALFASTALDSFQTPNR